MAELSHGLEDLVAVALVAALAPLVVAMLPGPRTPQVVVFLLGGILIGPHVLGLAETGNIALLANIGLGFLFLLAGYELDPRVLRQRPGQLAITGWLISAAITIGVVGALGAAGDIRDYVPVGLALTTTALGTLLPILRDNKMLDGEFGEHVHAAGTIGELFPILIIARAGAARLDTPDEHRHPFPREQVRCGRLRRIHPGLLHRLRDDARPPRDHPGPAPAADLLRPAAARARGAVAVRLQAGDATAAAAGDDVHHGDHDAAAGRPRGDRRAGRRDAPPPPPPP